MPSSTSLPDLARFETVSLLQSAIDTLPDAIFVKDLEHRWIAMNQAFCKVVGHPYDALLGRTDLGFWPPEQTEIFWRQDDEVFQSGMAQENEDIATGADGVPQTFWTRKLPMRDAEGKVTGLIGICSDISIIKSRVQKEQRLEAENHEQKMLIAAQTAMIDQLAVPVIQLWEGILLLPLVGEISERRAGQILESLLQAIRSSGARSVILDVTGVPLMDAAVASYLVRTASAASLLGCQSIVVGIGPGIAQTLVSLEVDFRRIVTRGSLQSGLELAMARLAR